jgi:uncharacterized protein YjbI with pentapeptide repeats
MNNPAENPSGKSNHYQSSTITYIIALGLMGVGLWLEIFWLVGLGIALGSFLSLPILFQAIREELLAGLTPLQRRQLFALITMIVALLSLGKILGLYNHIDKVFNQVNWDAVGAIAESFGALGQILIAVLAVYIAWRQYVISRDLTIEQNRLTTQQNILTQQQTIDTYFQGVCDLALDDEGFLEDWPQEQAFAEGRTAALLGSIDPAGKAKVLRFLSQSKLLTPLKRDRRLGKPIFNGDGGYEEDRLHGVKVIDLGVMLAGADLSQTDLRWTDLSDANLIRGNLSQCDLVKANFSRAILYNAKLSGANIKGARFFYGNAQTASPRNRDNSPNYITGEYTGAVIENADFTDVKDLSPEQKYYICAYGGEKTRGTVPGGCEGIPNKLSGS